ncbi:MAG TPA: hypothetical protein VGL56_11355 [Fimbriimonadaceae bacterium]|jgi:hypothetical protein
MSEGRPATRALSTSRLWFSLSLPGNPKELEPLAEAAVKSDCPIDISSQPALWGHYLRGANREIVAIGGLDLTLATSFDHAADLVYAKMLEILCAIGQETMSCFFLPVYGRETAVQMQGAVRAVSNARAEGNLQNVGVYAAGNADFALQQLQRYEVFEVILAPRNHSTPEALGWPKSALIRTHSTLVTCSPFNWGGGMPFFQPLSSELDSNVALRQQILKELGQEFPVMVGVRTAAEIEEAMEALNSNSTLDLSEALTPYRERFSASEHGRLLQTQRGEPS